MTHGICPISCRGVKVHSKAYNHSDSNPACKLWIIDPIFRGWYLFEMRFGDDLGLLLTLLFTDPSFCSDSSFVHA